MTARLANPALLPLIAATLLAADVDGLGSVRVELTETEFVHLQPQQVHLSVSGEVKLSCVMESHNLLKN